MPNFCPNCGAALKYPEAEICPSCGVRIREPPVAKNEWTKIIIAILAAVAVVAVLLAAALYIVVLIGQVSGPPAAVANVSVVTPAAQFVNPGFETGTDGREHNLHPRGPEPQRNLFLPFRHVGNHSNGLSFPVRRPDRRN